MMGFSFGGREVRVTRVPAMQQWTRVCILWCSSCSWPRLARRLRWRESNSWLERGRRGGKEGREEKERRKGRQKEKRRGGEEEGREKKREEEKEKEKEKRRRREGDGKDGKGKPGEGAHV